MGVVEHKKMPKLHITFYASDKPREIMLAEALKIGAAKHGDTLEARRTGEYGETDNGDDLRYPGPTPDTDVVIAFGVKGKSRQIISDHLQVGRSTLFFDKGYSRWGGEGGHTEYSRISVNGSDPLDYFMRPGEDRNTDRFDGLVKRLLETPERKKFRHIVTYPEARSKNTTGNILICGSSEKYHAFHGLEHPTTWAERLVRELRKLTDRQIIYRPKPSWKNARPIAGTSISTKAQSIGDALRSCHVLVTHGSAAAMDAILYGVSALALGRSIAQPVSETILTNIEAPFWPGSPLLNRWCNAMAYCQWTTEELRTGEAWAELKKEIVRQGKLR